MSKERIRRTLDFLETDRVPVMPHWWGLYKFELAGLVQDYHDEYIAWSMRGEELAAVDEGFIRAFSPDILHLSAGSAFITPDPVKERYIQELAGAVRRLDSLAVIDEYCRLTAMSRQETLDSRIYAHVGIHARHHQDDFIAMNEGNPIGTVCDNGWILGFEGSYVALVEHPREMEYLINRMYECRLPQMEALRDCGADAFIGSETLCSADLISPALFRALVLPAQQMFYKRINAMGLTPIAYFTGNIMPLLDDIRDMGIRALMVEEDKKGFQLPIGEISRRLHGAVAVFGNIDGVGTMLQGTPDDVRRAVTVQLDEAETTGFVVSCGSPLAFHTPPDNIRAMREAALAYTRH